MKIKHCIVLLTVIITFCVSKVYAQANLQFNQVLTYSGLIAYGSNPTIQSSPIYTVPSGKVWKVESRSVVGYATYFYLNGIRIDGNPGGSSTGGSPDGKTLWLKSGDQIYYETVSYGGFNYYLSIIEFNIVN